MRRPAFRSISFPLAFHAALLGGTAVSHAECSPSDPIDIEAGDSIFCSGVDSDGFLNPPFDIILVVNSDGFLVPFQTTIPVNGLNVTVGSGATVLGGPTGQAIAFSTPSHSVTNNGTIRASDFGIGSDFGGTTVTNNGVIDVGGAFGGGGVGFRGSNVIVTNTTSGTISATGPGYEGIGIFGFNADITNDGTIAVDGSDVGAIGVEGNSASVTHSGTIEVTGNRSIGIGIEGENAQILSTGDILVSGTESAGIGLEGTGSIVAGAGSIVTDSDTSAGIGAYGDGISIESNAFIRNLGSRSAGIALIGSGTSLTLGPNSVANTFGSLSYSAVLAGDGSEIDLTLIRGSGASFTIDPLATANIGGASGGAGYVFYHDDSVFDGFGTITGGGIGATGIVLNGNGMLATANGTLELSGANSTGLAFGVDTSLTSGTAEGGLLTLEGDFEMTGATSTAVRIAGSDLEVVSDATVKTLKDSVGFEIMADDISISTTEDSSIENGGMLLTGNQITLENAGAMTGKGITVTEGSGAFDIANDGDITLGVPPEFDADFLAGLLVQSGEGKIANSATISGDANTIGVQLDRVDGALEILNDTNGVLATESALLGTEAGPELTFTNLGKVETRTGVSIIGGQRALLDNQGAFDISDPLAAAVLVDLLVDDEASLTNAGDMTLTSLSAPSQAIRLNAVSGKSTFQNTGNITVTGTDTVSGIQVFGEEVEAIIESGSIDIQSGGAGPFSAVSASASLGNARVRNDGAVRADGALARGLAISGQTLAPTFDLTNSGLLSARGQGAVGMYLDTKIAFDTTGGVPKTRVIANEDQITVDGADARGIATQVGTNGTRIENAGYIDVGGDGSIGIEAFAVTDDYIFNANRIVVSGENAIGISVTGDYNTVMNGQDAATFPIAGAVVGSDGLFFDDPLQLDPVESVSAFIDLATSNAGNVPLSGAVQVTGTGAVGVNIAGDFNRIANVPGYLRAPQLPSIGEGSPILASGAGSVGVNMSGSGNIFSNLGTIQGDAYSIRDGSGGNTFLNYAYLFGDVDLGGGNDTFVVRTGSSLDGLGNGGAGVDTLVAGAWSGASGTPPGPVVLNGSQFTGFEVFEKVNPGRVTLGGNLAVSSANVRSGELLMASGAAITGNMTVGGLASLSGSGTFASIAFQSGSVASPGVSAGTWDILGDLTFEEESTLYLDFAGPIPGEGYDVINVFGNVAATGMFDMVLSFVDGFRPGDDEVLNVFNLSNPDQSDFLDFADVSILGLGAASYSFETYGTSVGLKIDQLTPIPLPGTLLNLSAAMLGLAAFKGRRKRAWPRAMA